MVPIQTLEMPVLRTHWIVAPISSRRVKSDLRSAVMIQGMTLVTLLRQDRGN